MILKTMEEIAEFDSRMTNSIAVIEAGKEVSAEILKIEVESEAMKVFLSSLYYDLEETIKDLTYEISIKKGE